MINKNGNNIEGVADFVLPTMAEIDNIKDSISKLGNTLIYNVNNTVIDFGGGTSLSTYSFYAKDIPTLNSMLIAAKTHKNTDAPVEGIFTFVNFTDINGTNVPIPVSVKTTSVWYSDDGKFNCAFLLCGKMCTLISEVDYLDEIIDGAPFTITLE